MEGLVVVLSGLCCFSSVVGGLRFEDVVDRIGSEFHGALLAWVVFI